MVDENMSLWEDKMTAGERRILMNNFCIKIFDTSYGRGTR